MLLDRAVRQTVVHQVKGISRAFLTQELDNGDSVLHLKTEGINMQVNERKLGVLKVFKNYIMYSWHRIHFFVGPTFFFSAITYKGSYIFFFFCVSISSLAVMIVIQIFALMKF